MEKENDEVKAFIRLLKETGLYIEWIKNRKKYCARTVNVEHTYLGDHVSLGSLISSSFVWTDTDNYTFWAKLSTKPPCYMKPSEILNNKDALETIKKIIEENFKII